MVKSLIEQEPLKETRKKMRVWLETLTNKLNQPSHQMILALKYFIDHAHVQS